MQDRPETPAPPIRAAREADCDRLTRIAHTAKAHWGYPEDWLAEWAPQLTITPASLRELEIHLAETDGGPIAFYGLQFEGAKASLEHLWVDPPHMGRGVGRALYRHALRRLRHRGVPTLEIESDPFAEPFYRAMGAARVGNVQRPVRDQPRELPLLVHRLTPGNPREP